MEDLNADHDLAWKAFAKECIATDCVVLGHEASKAAWKRWNHASRVEEKALTAICAYRALTTPDRERKALFWSPSKNIRRHRVQFYCRDERGRLSSGGGGLFKAILKRLIS